MLFSACASLTKAPDLHATTLAGCYYAMFYGCTSLKSVKAAFVTSPVFFADCYSCTYHWLNGVSSTGTFHKNKNATWRNADEGIPEGWTVIKYES